MRILFISRDLIAANLAYLLIKEGCEVKLYIDVRKRRKNFENMIPKTNSWENELSWVGKEGLIVFDDVGYGQIQDQLRKDGYKVFGGSTLADRLEWDRSWTQQIFQRIGMQTLPTWDFESIDAAINFLKKNEGPWVIKQNGYLPKDLNYVGDFKDNRDVISVLLNYRIINRKYLGVITLQKRVFGVEIGIARYFNGHDWVGPIEFNVEYKKLFPGNLGPSTTEMGTIAWYDSNENNLIFKKTLQKIKPFLQSIDFRGDFDIGCIANEKGVFPLEATPRLGTPIIHLHTEIHSSPWSKLLMAVAEGKEFNLKWKKGFGIVVLVSLPPFPYNREISEPSPVGLSVDLSDIKERDRSHIHFEGVRSNKKVRNPKILEISDPLGYVLYVTGLGKTISQARKKSQQILSRIHIPKMLYRNDIGVDLELENITKLKRWGYL